MLCATGLPLIFHDEIDALVGSDPVSVMAGPASADNGVPLDLLVTRAVAQRPGSVPLFVGFSQDTPLITVTVGPAADAPAAEMTLISFDRATGVSVEPEADSGVLSVLLDVHTDLFLGQWGQWFLGAMGALFAIAIVSGVVLYAPFTRRLRFGALRSRRGSRVRRLDTHNLFGIVTVAWALVVGLTGVVNAYADPMVAAWRTGALAQMTSAYVGEPALSPQDYGSLDAAMASAKAAQPGLSPQFVGFPGGSWSSGHHYAVFFQGGTPLTSHVLTPVLVDVRTSQPTDTRAMPWYMQALMLSKPLHFGDYGALPLKVIWAAFDLLTIWVLISGLRLWVGRKWGARRGDGPASLRRAPT